MKTNWWLVGSVILTGGWITASAISSDLPDSKLNPQDGRIEITQTVWKGDNYDVRFVVRPAIGDSDEAPEVVTVSSHPADDLGARSATAPSGDTWVVWWRDSATAQILVRKRTHADGSWTGERVASSPGEDSKEPWVVYDGNQAWIAFEIEQEDGSTGIAVNVINDEPDPIGIRDVLSSTGHAGHVDARVHAGDGQLWATWIEDGTTVGWSEYDHGLGAWSAVGYESYASDGIEQARERIKQAVQGN